MCTVHSNKVIDFNTSNEASNGKLWISSRNHILQKSYQQMMTTKVLNVILAKKCKWQVSRCACNFTWAKPKRTELTKGTNRVLEDLNHVNSWAFTSISSFSFSFLIFFYFRYWHLTIFSLLLGGKWEAYYNRSSLFLKDSFFKYFSFFIYWSALLASLFPKLSLDFQFGTVKTYTKEDYRKTKLSLSTSPFKIEVQGASFLCWNLSS